MYEVYRLGNGRRDLVDKARDYETARQRAIEASAFQRALFIVVREGFGDPLYYAYDGVGGDQATVLPRVHIAPAESVAGQDDPPRGRRKGPSETKARITPQREYKIGPAYVVECKAVDDGKLGIVEAVVSVYGVLDDGRDIISNSFFAKSLSEHGHRVRVLNSHSLKDGVLEVIGKPLLMREVGREELPSEVLNRYPEATGGFLTTTQFMLSDARSKAVYDRLDAGWINEWSIGFDDLQSEKSRLVRRTYNGTQWRYDRASMEDPPESLVTDDSGRPIVARLLRQGRLWEYSPTVWGMNPATSTVSVKDIGGESTETDALSDDDIAQDADTTALDVEQDPDPIDTKVGRVLSSVNFTRIQQAYTLLNEVMQSAGLLDEEAADDTAARHGELQHTSGDGPHEGLTPISDESATPTETGPQANEAPDTKRADLLRTIEQRLAEVEEQ